MSEAIAQPIQFLLIYASVGARSVAALKARRRQLHRPRKFTIIGQKKQALSVDIEAPDTHYTGHVLGQTVKDGRTAFRIFAGRHQSSWFMIAPQACCIRTPHRDPVNQNTLTARDLEGWRIQYAAIHIHPTISYHPLDVTA
jgi:hypothetical protein